MQNTLNRREKWSKICSCAVAMLAVVVLCYLAALSLFETVQIEGGEQAVFQRDTPWAHLFFLFFGLLLLCLWGRKLACCSGKGLLTALLIFTCTVGSWLVFTWNVQPVADQGTVLSAAQAFAVGDFTMLDKGGYLFVYPHQLGLVAYFQLVNLFAGPNTYLAVQALNTLALCACYFLLYRIARLLFPNKEVGLLTILVMFGCLQPLLYVSFVYGNLMGLAAGLEAVYLELSYFEQRKWSFALGSALFIAISVALRNHYMIFLVAMAVFYLFDAVFERQKRSYWMVLIIVAANALLGGLISTGYHLASGREIQKGMPKALWVAMGMQEGPRTSGWYNDYTWELYESVDYDAARARKIALQDVKKRVEEFTREPGQALSFYYRKTASMWNNPDYQAFWINLERPSRIEGSAFGKSLFGGGLRDALFGWMNLSQSAIFLGALFYFAMEWKNVRYQQLFLAVIFLGCVFFHLAWEAKGQYALPYFLLLIPYAAAGWCRAWKSCEGILKRRKMRLKSQKKEKNSAVMLPFLKKIEASLKEGGTRYRAWAGAASKK